MKFTRWSFPTRNLQIGDLVCLREDGLVPMKLPLAQVVLVHPGSDCLVRVATVRMTKVTYKGPVTLICLLRISVHCLKSVRSCLALCSVLVV